MTEDLRALAEQYLRAYDGVEGGISRLARAVLSLLPEKGAAERVADENYTDLLDQMDEAWGTADQIGRPEINAMIESRRTHRPTASLRQRLYQAEAALGEIREALTRLPHTKDCRINPGGPIMEALGDPEVRPCSCGRDAVLSFDLPRRAHTRLEAMRRVCGAALAVVRRFKCPETLADLPLGPFIDRLDDALRALAELEKRGEKP